MAERNRGEKMTLKEKQNAWIKDFEERMGYLPTYSILPDELKDEETMETKRYYTPPKRD